jgi:hypothetical protein
MTLKTAGGVVARSAGEGEKSQTMIEAVKDRIKPGKEKVMEGISSDYGVSVSAAGSQWSVPPRTDSLVMFAASEFDNCLDQPTR